MGDYWSLRFRAPMSERGLEVATRLSSPPWPCWADLGEEFAGYAAMPKAIFIPKGGLSYAPRDWEQACEVVDGRWRVCCSIKIGSPEVGVFLDEVLPRLLADQVTVEWWDETTGTTEIWVVCPSGPRQRVGTWKEAGGG